MTRRTGLAALLLIACVLLALGSSACGGGGDDSEADATPTQTEALEPTVPPPTDTPGPKSTLAPTEPVEEQPPEAAPISLGPDVTPVEEGTLDLTIAPGGSSDIDPLALAGDVPPSCAGLAFSFSWQVRDPYPADGVQLRVVGVRMGATVELGSGPSGGVDIGCFGIEFHNDGDVALTVQVRYASGSFGG